MRLLRNLKDTPICKNKPMKLRQLPSFLNRISTLLNEGYTFSDSIEMLLPHHVDNPEAWQRKILEKLKNGEGATEILECFSIPKHYLVALRISEESGRLAQSLETISQQLEFNEKLRKRLINLLSYPFLLSILLTSIFIAFRTYFLPSITQILDARTDVASNATIFISTIFLRLPDVLFVILVSTICLVITFTIYIKRLDVQKQLPLMLKLPLINYFYKLHITNLLAKTMGELLIGGITLQQTLAIIQEQKLNKMLAYMSKEIEGQVIFGESLSTAVYNLGWFSAEFDQFIKHGEKSGYLGKQLLIYSELMEEKIQSFLKKGVSVIQPIFFIIIALSIIAAYLSILLPMYELIEII